jgi:hypothetical protein
MWKLCRCKINIKIEVYLERECSLISRWYKKGKRKRLNILGFTWRSQENRFYNILQSHFKSELGKLEYCK